MCAVYVRRPMHAGSIAASTAAWSQLMLTQLHQTTTRDKIGSAPQEARCTVSHTNIHRLRAATATGRCPGFIRLEYCGMHKVQHTQQLALCRPLTSTKLSFTAVSQATLLVGSCSKHASSTASGFQAQQHQHQLPVNSTCKTTTFAPAGQK